MLKPLAPMFVVGVMWSSRVGGRGLSRVIRGGGSGGVNGRGRWSGGLGLTPQEAAGPCTSSSLLPNSMIISGGGSGCVGGGSVGGLGPTGPWFGVLLPLLSLSPPSEDMLMHRDPVNSLILTCISLHLERASKVSWFMLP